MKQRGVCKNPVKSALGQLHRHKILMENLAPRLRACHGDKLLRSVEPDGLVPQGSEVAEIAAGSTTKIKDRIRRVGLYRVEERRVVLADIVIARAVPESPGEAVVIRDGRVREASDLPCVISSGRAAHRSSTFPIAPEGASGSHPDTLRPPYEGERCRSCAISSGTVGPEAWRSSRRAARRVA